MYKPFANFFNRGLISINRDNYLNLLIIIAPLLNFLSGISIDLSAPSLPAISQYFGASQIAVKNTISASMFGSAFGCIIFGNFVDIFGRRSMLLIGLIIFSLSSLAAPFSMSINQLIFLRVVQGLSLAVVSVAPRAIIIDKFTGHKFNVAMLYTSIAYSFGPIIGPFVGGFLQEYFGWKANFLTLGLVSSILFLFTMLFIGESIPKRQLFSFKSIILGYCSILRVKEFLASAVVCGAVYFELMIFPTVGAFIVEHLLLRSAIIYGNCALVVSCGYLVGSLLSRLLLRILGQARLISIGFGILFLSMILQFVFSFFSQLNLFNLVFPVASVGVGVGFIYSHVFARCVKLFPLNAGAATSLLIFFTVIVTAIGIFIISHFTITALLSLAIIFAVTIVIQALVYYRFLARKIAIPVD